MKDEGNRKFVLRQLDFMSKQTLILLVSLVSLYSYKNNNNKVSQNLEKRRPNLDSILKSRDITLSTKVHLVKAMVCPVVMHGCENWTIQKAEHRRINAFELCGVGEDS